AALHRPQAEVLGQLANRVDAEGRVLGLALARRARLLLAGAADELDVRVYPALDLPARAALAAGRQRGAGGSDRLAGEGLREEARECGPPALRRAGAEVSVGDAVARAGPLQGR